MEFIDHKMWEINPVSRHVSAEKHEQLKVLLDNLLDPGVILLSKATVWSQVHLNRNQITEVGDLFSFRYVRCI